MARLLIIAAIGLLVIGCNEDTIDTSFTDRGTSELVQQYNSQDHDLPVLWPDKVNGRTSGIVSAAQQVIHSSLDTDVELQAFMDRIGQPSWEYLQAGDVYLFPTFGDSTVAKSCLLYNSFKEELYFDGSQPYFPELLYPIDDRLVGGYSSLDVFTVTDLLESRAENYVDCEVSMIAYGVLYEWHGHENFNDDNSDGIWGLPISAAITNIDCFGGNGDGTTTNTPTGGGGSTSNQELRRACANKDNSGVDCMICMKFAPETAQNNGVFFEAVFEECGCITEPAPSFNDLFNARKLLTIEGVSDCILCRRFWMAGSSALWSLAEEYADIEFACTDENPIDRLNQVACGDGGPYSQDYAAIQEVAAELEAEKNRGNFKKGEIEEFLDNNDFPCDDRTDDEIKADLLEQACNYLPDHVGIDRSYGTEWMAEAMAGVDKIIPDPTLEACDKINCIFNELQSSENDLWCNTIGGFENVESSTLRPQVGIGNTNLPSNYFTSLHPNRRGVTTVNSAGEIVIAFNPKLCDAVSPLDIAHSILHEGIHADIWRYLQDNWQGDWPIITEYSYEQTWDLLFDLVCDESGVTDQHQQMMKGWIEDLAKGLRDFNDPDGNWEDYRYRALKGIYIEGDPCSEQIIGAALWSEYQGQDANLSEGFGFELCPD